jgi:hypothetical protein
MFVIRLQTAIAAYKVWTTKVVLQPVPSAIVGEQVGIGIPASIFRSPGLVQPARVLVPLTHYTPPVDLVRLPHVVAEVAGLLFVVAEVAGLRRIAARDCHHRPPLFCLPDRGQTARRAKIGADGAKGVWGDLMGSISAPLQKDAQNISLGTFSARELNRPLQNPSDPRLGRFTFRGFCHFVG